MDETHFDAVNVGSGFGGSVIAYRLAEAGLRVCLLERGKAYPPGSFSRSPYRMRRNFWDPCEGLHGLYNFWGFSGLDALVSSGLGGGSLIYANVLLRKDEKWFVREDVSNGGYEYWPVTRADLDPHYDRVEGMLRPQRYPFDKPPYDETSKTRAFREATRRLGTSPSCPSSPSPSPTRARSRCRGSRSARSTPTSTAAPATPAGSWESATSGATTGPRTPWSSVHQPQTRLLPSRSLP